MKLEFSRQSFEKSSNIKFNQNLSSGSRVVPCGRKDRQTALTKLIVAFRNSANAPEKGRHEPLKRYLGGPQTDLDVSENRKTFCPHSGSTGLWPSHYTD